MINVEYYNYLSFIIPIIFYSIGGWVGVGGVEEKKKGKSRTLRFGYKQHE